MTSSLKRKKSPVQPGHRGSGGHTVPARLRAGQVDAKYAISLFPELDKLMTRRAGLLSGGEQQMLTLARALGRRPAVLLIDELSLGLAPIVVQRLLA